MDFEFYVYLQELLPPTIFRDILRFEDVWLDSGEKAVRITMDRLISEAEEAVMSKNPKLVGVGSVAAYRYAPEIRKSYFYVLLEEEEE